VLCAHERGYSGALLRAWHGEPCWAESRSPSGRWSGMAKIGYAGVSTSDQNPEAQAARLREHGCTRVFTDHGVTGRLASRPHWDACRAFLRDGDVLIVTKLDRIGRSVGNLVSVAGELHQLGVDLVVLDQAIDTGSPAGRMLVQMLAAIAEFTVISTPHEAAKSPQPGSLPEGAWSGETASRFPRADGR
jgi:hypothetical protein